MTTDFPTAPPAYGLEGPSAGSTVEKSQPASHTEFLTLPEQALKIYPWICGRCAREFNRSNLRELTVHHRDHNHQNNPPDGSNWELLCLYCHDNEHQRQLEAANGSAVGIGNGPAATHSPFANLKTLLGSEDS